MIWKNFWTKTNEPRPGIAVLSLRNPGGKYVHTWHNAGDIALRAAFPDADFVKKSALSGDLAEESAGNIPLYLLRSNTFMNVSGTAARAILKYANLAPDQLVVIHDDIDLPLNKVKVSQQRGSGGHNGIRDIQNKIGEGKFWRIRIGIQKPDGKPPVLGQIPKTDEDVLVSLGKDIRKALELWATEGPTAAQNFLNAK